MITVRNLGPRSWRLVALALLLGALAVAGWCERRGEIAARKDAAARPAPFRAQGGGLVAAKDAAQFRYVSVETAALAPPLALLPAPARIVVPESRSVPVVAPLAGRVEQVVVELGQEVRKGDKLIAVRSASVPELGREIDTARAALGVRRASAERVRDLVHLRALPDKELALAEEEQREAEITLRAAEGKRRSFHLDRVDATGLYWLAAPRAGTVVARQALAGMEVGPDRTEPLLAIADLDEVLVVADLFEADVAGVTLGQRAEVAPAHAGTTATEPPLYGTVEYVAALVDPLRRTVAVRVRVTNAGHRLRPNAFAQVTFMRGGGDAPRIVVPAEAIVTDGPNPVVFVRHPTPSGDVRFERRAVRIGRSRDGKTEVVEGLAPGESYVNHGALLLLNALDLGQDAAGER